MFGQASWSPFDPPAPPLPPSPGSRSGCTDLSGEQNGRVEVLRVPVAGLVEMPLPVAEVAQRQPPVVGHFWAPLLIFHYQHFHHHQVDGVPDAGVLVDAGGHRHESQDVVLLEDRDRKREGLHLPARRLPTATASRYTPPAPQPRAPLWAD